MFESSQVDTHPRQQKDEFEGIPDAEYMMPCLPTELEVAQARLVAIEQRARLARIQAEYERQMAITDEIQNRLQTAKATLFDTEAIFAGIRRLPAELLGEVFTFHVHGNQQSPWVLMSVNRAWRSAALLTRNIWGAIMLTRSSPKKKGGSRIRVIDGKEVCTTESQVQRALTRAGGTALDLHIHSAGTRRRRISYRTWGRSESYMNILIRCITNEKDKRKIRSLEIDGDRDFDLDLDELDFRSLETLRLEGEFPELVRKVKTAAVRLRRLVASTSDIILLEDARWLRQLEELEIKPNSHYGMNDRAATRKILFSTPSLSSLIIHGGTIEDIHDIESRIDIPGLKTLVLYRVSGVWPIECPNLTHLTIEFVWSNPEELAPNSIHLPYLQFFNFKCNRSLAYLRAFVAPSLHQLDLKGSSSKQRMRDGMKLVWKKGEIPNINPVILRVHHTSPHPKVVADAVKTMTLLEELRMEYVNIGLEFFQELHPIPAPQPKKKPKQNVSPWIIGAPKLKVLTFDLDGRKPKNGDAKEYENTAKELLAMRKKANAPMERIEIRLTKEGGWMVFKDE